MAETDVFMSESDVDRVVSYLLRCGCILVPSAISNQPVAQNITSLRTFREFRANNRCSLFFAVSPAWTVVPFEWIKLEKNGAIQYAIRQKTGGPTLDILAPNINEDSNSIAMIPCGSISFHTTFWNFRTSKTERPSMHLKAMYVKIVNLLKEESMRIRSTKRNYVIAEGAILMLKNGSTLGPPFENKTYLQLLEEIETSSESNKDE